MNLSQKDLIDSTIDQLYEIQGKKKSKIPEPDIRWKNRRTIFGNFSIVCKGINRTSNEDMLHLKGFLEKESDSESSIDGAGKLLFIQRMDQAKIKKHLMAYMMKYIVCPSCKSRDTTIEKNGRLRYIDCKRCNQTNYIKDY
jgi:translation initiation factor 2 subunit 2